MFIAYIKYSGKHTIDNKKSDKHKWNIILKPIDCLNIFDLQYNININVRLMILRPEVTDALIAIASLIDILFIYSKAKLFYIIWKKM